MKFEGDLLEDPFLGLALSEMQIVCCFNGLGRWTIILGAKLWFLPVQVGGRTLAGHDEAVLTVSSPGDGCEFWVTIK